MQQADLAISENSIESLSIAIRSLEKIEGIESVSISFMTLLMELEYEEANQEEIIEKVRKVIKKEEPDVTMEEI